MEDQNAQITRTPGATVVTCGLVTLASPLVPQHRSLAVSARGSSVWTLMQPFREQMECADTAITSSNCTRAYYAYMLMITASLIARLKREKTSRLSLGTRLWSQLAIYLPGV